MRRGWALDPAHSSTHRHHRHHLRGAPLDSAGEAGQACIDPRGAAGGEGVGGGIGYDESASPQRCETSMIRAGVCGDIGLEGAGSALEHLLGRGAKFVWARRATPSRARSGRMPGRAYRQRVRAYGLAHGDTGGHAAHAPRSPAAPVFPDAP